MTKISTTSSVPGARCAHGHRHARQARLLGVAGQRPYSSFPRTPGLKAVDTTGAGDCFVGGFAAGLRQVGRRYRCRRASYGNTAAALSVTKFGTAPSMPSKKEITAFLKRWSARQTAGPARKEIRAGRPSLPQSNANLHRQDRENRFALWRRGARNRGQGGQGHGGNAIFPPSPVMRRRRARLHFLARPKRTGGRRVFAGRGLPTARIRGRRQSEDHPDTSIAARANFRCRQICGKPSNFAGRRRGVCTSVAVHATQSRSS